MAKLGCPCGHVFSDTGSPNESLHVVRDRDMPDYTRHVWRAHQLCDVERGGMLPEAGTAASEAFHDSLYASLAAEGTLWVCPACGRLFLRLPGEDAFRVFAPERDQDAEPGAAPDPARIIAPGSS